MKQLGAALLLMVAVCGTVAGCHRGERVKALVSWGDINVDQLGFVLTDSTGKVRLPLTLEPANPRTLTSPQSVYILLPTEAAYTATLAVEARFSATRVGFGHTTKPLERGTDTTFEVTVYKGGPCGDCAGCCSGTTCVLTASTSACGTGGGLCTDCGEQGDSCGSGGCKCGTGDVCGVNQACVGSTCVCTPESCPGGCCSGNGECILVGSGGQGSFNCGTAGQKCDQCNSSGTCAAGVCSSCNSATCDGCCSGNSCVKLVDTDTRACGLGGVACAVCDNRSNVCVTSVGCACGALGGPCAEGQVCTGSVCVTR